MHKIVKEELENWDEPLESATAAMLANKSRSNSALPPLSASSGQKQTWQQF